VKPPTTLIAQPIPIKWAITLASSSHFVDAGDLADLGGIETETNLTFRPLRGEFLELLHIPERKAAIAKGNPLARMRRVTPMLRMIPDVCRTQYRTLMSLSIISRRRVFTVSRRNRGSAPRIASYAGALVEVPISCQYATV
jgi:hypothetical protein